ncbi:hypothetical protein [Actinokineospora iranica]|uniref:Uncharacterized protein n=1 Tax=Actinokineospora iranica TaxID=1271860 RepID=A0A1G6RZN2_9PSEU|nr:hypothetical protein [Actinokineospora iranica]SDD10132.1 hypothetical protein SAMN05216174_107131 [Actinokineospora iranica]
MWMALALPLLLMLAAIGMQRLEPRVISPFPPTSEDPLQQPMEPMEKHGFPRAAIPARR